MLGDCAAGEAAGDTAVEDGVLPLGREVDSPEELAGRACCGDRNTDEEDKEWFALENELATWGPTEGDRAGGGRKALPTDERVPLFEALFRSIILCSSSICVAEACGHWIGAPRDR